MSASASTARPPLKSTIKAGRDALVLVALLALALVLNPDKTRHDDAIRAEMARRSPIASFFGAGHLASWVAEYHSIGIASYTKIDGRIVTIGAFGIVIPR
jgi:hypothetical protein